MFLESVIKNTIYFRAYLSIFQHLQVSMLILRFWSYFTHIWFFYGTLYNVVTQEKTTNNFKT